MSGWFFVVMVIWLTVGGEVGEDEYARSARWALPFASEQECREFMDHADPAVDFDEPAIGVFWSCWENPPLFVGDDNG